VYAGATLLTAGFGGEWNQALIAPPTGVLVILGALVPLLVAEGEVWRLASSTLLHASFVHLTVNMLALFFLGTFAEQVMGRTKFLALYVVSGLSGGIAFLYFGSFDTPAVGASGAIFGIVGGILGLAVRQGTFSWQNPIIRQLLILTLINLFIGASIPQVSNTAHLGGLIGGAAFGWLISEGAFRRRSALAPTLIFLAAEAGLIAFWLATL
jgi:rhomboid protease GluP